MTESSNELRNVSSAVDRRPNPSSSRLSSLPDDESQRQRFIDEELKPRKGRPEEIADMRYSGEWGHYDPKDPTKSSWKVRQANRYLEELKFRRGMTPVVWGVWLTFAAVMVGILAMPVKDSLLCRIVTHAFPDWNFCS